MNNMLRFLHNPLLILCMFVCMFLIAPVTHQGVQRAEALTVTVVGDTSWSGMTTAIKSALSEVSNLATSIATKSLALKEFSLDGIARGLAQNALNQLTSDMVNWINGGMNGSPAFITNLEEFLLNVADQTAGEFIYGEELAGLCEPIQLQVRAALLTQYVQEERGTYVRQCPFDQIEGASYTAFVDGDFNQGGWRAFFELTVGNETDPIKAYYDARGNLAERVADAEQNKRDEAAWGRGFMPKEVCTAIESSTGFSRQRCETVTPGALVQDALSYFVGELPAQRLLEIDEVNEVFTALASSLTNQAIQGVNGLLGLGGNTKYSNNSFGTGSQSYLDALRNEQTLPASGVADALDEALAAEAEYIDLQELIIENIEEAREDFEDAEDDAGSCFNLEFPEDLEDEIETAETNIEVSEQVTIALTDLKSRLTTATSTAMQDVVSRQYLALQEQGLIRTEYDNERLRIEFIEVDLEDRLDELAEDIAREVQQCGQ